MPRTMNATKLADILEATINAAPERERHILGQALEDYAATFPTTFNARKAPMPQALLDAIEEATEARIQR